MSFYVLFIVYYLVFSSVLIYVIHDVTTRAVSSRNVVAMETQH